MCDRQGCDGPPRYQPILVLQPAGATIDPAPEFILGLAVCQAHSESTTAADYIADDGWAHLERVFSIVHGVPPDRVRTTVRYQPIS